MAVTQNPAAKDAPAPYTALRPFYWGGEVQATGTVLQLTKAEAADLRNANKVVPGAPEAAAPAKPTKPAKAVTPAAAPAPTEEVPAP
jgi:hypothetical protein